MFKFVLFLLIIVTLLFTVNPLFAQINWNWSCENGVLITNGSAAVARSSINGILDFCLDGELIDNGVVIAMVNGEVNFSEINNVYPEAVSQDSPQQITLKYAFPNGAAVLLSLSVRQQFPQIAATLTVLPESQPLQKLGLGNFFGVLHNFDRILVNGAVHLPDGYGPLGTQTDYFQAGSFKTELGSWSSLQSYNVNSRCPSMYQSASGVSQYSVEIRNLPWHPDHQSLNPSPLWFEMQALLKTDLQPGESWALQLGMC